MFIKREDYYLICDRNDELQEELKQVKEELKIKKNNELVLLYENTRLKRKEEELLNLIDSNTYNNIEIRLKKIKEIIKSK